MVIDIWSDIACPWCTIGRAHLQQALAAHDGEVTVRWRSFQLDPTMPPVVEGDYAQKLADKYGLPREQARAMMAQMAERMGIPGGSAKMREMIESFTKVAPGAGTEAGQAGLGGLIAAMQGAAATGGKAWDDMFDAMTKGTPVGQVAEDNAKLMIRAIIQAAKADGEIDAREREMILDQLKDADPAERAFVEKELAAPVDPMKLAQDTGEAMKAQVYSTSLMAIRPDNRAEVAYLRQLAQALGLSDHARDRVHAAMGVPPLPA